jgi:hypothetical protein
MMVIYNGAHFLRARLLDIGQHWQCLHRTSTLETSSECLLNLYDRCSRNEQCFSFIQRFYVSLQCCLYWFNPAFTVLLQITGLFGSCLGSNGQILYRIGMSRPLCVNRQTWSCSISQSTIGSTMVNTTKIPIQHGHKKRVFCTFSVFLLFYLQETMNFNCILFSKHNNWYNTRGYKNAEGRNVENSILRVRVRMI